MKVTFPALSLPEFKVKAGQFLNITLMGQGIVVPPSDITFWPSIKLTDEFTLFDTEDITKPILDYLAGIPKAVLNLFLESINEQLRDYYERHREEES